jgi:hypothetical protein
MPNAKKILKSTKEYVSRRTHTKNAIRYKAKSMRKSCRGMAKNAIHELSSSNSEYRKQGITQLYSC